MAKIQFNSARGQQSCHCMAERAIIRQNNELRCHVSHNTHFGHKLCVNTCISYKLQWAVNLYGFFRYNWHAPGMLWKVESKTTLSDKTPCLKNEDSIGCMLYKFTYCINTVLTILRTNPHAHTYPVASWGFHWQITGHHKKVSTPTTASEEWGTIDARPLISEEPHACH